MIFVGIDNGLMGGISAIENGELKLVKKMPVIKGGKGQRTQYDIQEIVETLRQLSCMGKLSVVLEKAQVTPIAGKNSCFSMGFCMGMMQGILESMKIPYQLIPARQWQNEVLKGMAGDTKAKSILWCKRRFPNQDWIMSPRSKKENDGLCDATCMAYYSSLNF